MMGKVSWGNLVFPINFTHAICTVGESIFPLLPLLETINCLMQIKDDHG